ncbi:Uroc1, partial [Symbiodinium microadriaticum]
EGANADLIIWSLQSHSQIPYYGSESRHRIHTIVKNGKAHSNPTAVLQGMHQDSAARLAALRARSSQPSTRSFSTSAARSADGKVISTGTVPDIQQTLTGFVELNKWGQITALPADCDLTKPPPALDPTVPHAPTRLTRLDSTERQLAITNALKYFHNDLHTALRPVCEHELDTYGHIYFYHLLPRQHIWAIPYADIPGKTRDARAMTHMILNNLNPEVAQFPQELITYGGNGAVFSNWAQFHITVRMLAKMGESQSLSMNSGHPAGLFPKYASADSPAAVISNGMMIPEYSTPAQLDRLYALGIVHGTTLTVAQAVAMQAASCGNKEASPTDGCRGKVFVTSGLGGMSGAQPKAAIINGAVCLIAEVDGNALRKRHAQGWLNEYFSSVEECVARAADAQKKGEAVSIGYLGNVVDLWEYLAATPADKRCSVAVGSDQTSLHNPYNGGYYPVGMSFEESNAMMTTDPAGFKIAVQKSLHRHLQAVQAMREKEQTLFFDYGNAFLLECHRAGCVVDASIPSYVECIMGPEFFDYGFGPYRWVCTSGVMDELQATDKIASDVVREQMNDPVYAQVIPQLKANLDWIARILYSDTEGRIECAVRMNRAVRDGVLSAPVVIGRDHHDVSGTDAPWRETANIKDGSNLTADMSVQNFIGDAMRGATWVSLHNGGGTGWGVASNGGFGLVLDGSERAERRARDMIFFDVTNGLTRRARA